MDMVGEVDDPEKVEEAAEAAETAAPEQKEGKAEKGKKPRKAAARPRKKKKAVVVTSARRKGAIARARVKEGKGAVRINSIKLDAMQNRYAREIISEPLRLAADYAPKLSIAVNTNGGGVIGQAQAARTAIARGLLEFTGDDDLKRKFLDYDRFLLVEDVRFVEPKKYKGRKARARFQKSYR